MGAVAKTDATAEVAKCGNFVRNSGSRLCELDRVSAMAHHNSVLAGEAFDTPRDECTTDQKGEWELGVPHSNAPTIARTGAHFSSHSWVSSQLQELCVQGALSDREAADALCLFFHGAGTGRTNDLSSFGFSLSTTFLCCHWPARRIRSASNSIAGCLTSNNDTSE